MSVTMEIVQADNKAKYYLHNRVLDDMKYMKVKINIQLLNTFQRIILIKSMNIKSNKRKI